MQLEGRSVLITGGGSGIGRGCALRYAAEGARVAVADLNAAAAAETVALITADGGHAEAVQADVTDPGDVEYMVHRAVEAFGRLDVLHNNAAKAVAGSAVDLSVDDWDATWKTTVSSVFLGVKYAVPRMSAGASVISTASISGLFGDVGYMAYNAAKGAVISMTRALAIDLGPLGIRVNCICPGIVRTPPTEPMLADEQLASMIQTAVPAGRLGHPDDIGRAAVFLASSASEYVTGQSIIVDGGLTSQHGVATAVQLRGIGT